MPARPKPLQQFLDAARTAFIERAPHPDGRASVARVFAALETPEPVPEGTGVRLPVCRHLSEVAVPSRFEAPALRCMVEAFVHLEPNLEWRQQRKASMATHASCAGSAGAMITGPGGYEPRRDVWLGVSLLAPGVRYPDHSHPPEETYLVLSEGAFRQQTGDWFEPGPGGSFYNPPRIVHAMRAGPTPLFAFWALWVGSDQS